jgi:hypothetical protein
MASFRAQIWSYQPSNTKRDFYQTDDNVQHILVRFSTDWRMDTNCIMYCSCDSFDT